LYLPRLRAGTGATTVISTIVNNLYRNQQEIWLAPTGAKSTANYSEKLAFTIHKKIYFPKKSSAGGRHIAAQQT
jgi:hypothetical protein